MLLSDLSIQGVLKAHLPAGLVAIAPVRDATLMSVVRALFYSEGFDPDSPFARAKNPVKAGCVIAAGDRRFRLVRDLTTGAAELGLEGEKPGVVSRSATEVTQYLRAQLRLVAPDVFEKIYWLWPDAFPSRRGAAGKPAAKSAVRPMLGDGALQSVAQHQPQAREIEIELQQLRQLARTQEKVEEIEFELDGLQKKKFAFDDIAGRRAGLEAKIKKLAGGLEGDAALDKLPANFAELAQSFERVKKKFHDEQVKLADEARSLEDRAPPPAPEPLVKDARFWAGVGGGAALLAASMFLRGDWRLLGLLDLAPFALAAAQALGFVGHLEAADRHRHRKQLVAERIKAAQLRYDVETMAVREAIKAFRVESAAELAELVGKRRQAKLEYEKACAVLKRFDETEGRALQSSEYAALLGRIAEVEQALAVSATGGDMRDVRARITELEGALAAAKSGATPRAPDPEPTPAEAARGPGDERALLVALAECAGTGVSQAAETWSKRTSDFSSRLFSSREASVEVDEAGRVSVAGRGWHELDPAQQDVVYLALRLSAFEIAAVKNPAPFFCERVTEIAHLPLETYAPFLKFLAKRAQVFVLCRDAAEAAGIEQVVTIG